MPHDFLELTPAEINLQIETFNQQDRQRDKDLYELASLFLIAFNNPKKFPKSLQKFRPDPLKTASNNREMDRQAGIIRCKIPRE